MARVHTSRRVMSGRRRPVHFEWVHDTFNNVAPAAVNLDDLLGNFKAQYAITANLPDIVIWRLHLKFSCAFTATTGGSSNAGVLLTCFVDSTKQTIVNQGTNPNDEHYLIYNQLYLTESLMQGPVVSPFHLYKEFDVKSHRRLVNINDSLLLQTVQTGVAVLTDYSVSVGILLKLP